MRDGARTAGATDDARSSHAARRRGADRRDQRAAVFVGRFVAGGALPERDLEVVRLRVAFADRDARRAGAVFVEVRRLEPLALFRRIDGREVVVAWRQPADPVLARLIGTRGHDLP